jgi:O-antigen/teichoic acid export membrane protein
LRGTPSRLAARFRAAIARVRGETSIAVSALSTLSLRIVGSGLTLLTTLVIARGLGPSNQGTYASVIFLWVLAVLLFGLGVQWVNATFAGRDPYQMPSFVTNSIIFVLLSGVLTGVAIVVLQVVNVAGHRDLVDGARSVLPWVPLGVGVAALDGLLWGSNRLIVRNSIVSVIGPLAILLAMILEVYVWRAGLNGAMSAWLSGYGLMALIASVIIARSCPRLAIPDFSLLRAGLWFGARSTVSHIVGTLNFQFDILLVALLIGVHAAGPYAVIETLSNLLFFIPTSISVALLPVIARETDATRATEWVNRALRISLFFGFGGAIFLAVATRLGLSLYGPDYSQAWLPLLALLPGVAFSSMAHITTVYWSSYALKPEINLYVVAVSLVIDVLADLLLIPRLGLLGAGIGATLGYSTMTLCTLSLFWHRSGCRPIESLLPKRSDFSAGFHMVRRILAPSAA